MMRHQTTVVSCAAVCGLWVCTLSSGQNALDSNLGVGTGGINTFTPSSNFRDRNLIITGDVIGGRGFRGSVGYTAEGDFRGALGSNDLFQYRAGSAMSSAPLFQMGTTYERLRFGQDIGIVEYRRAGSGAPASIMAQNPIALTDPADRFRVDRRIVSAANALAPQQAMEPRIVGSVQSEQNGLFVFNASPLRGLTVEHASESPALIGFNTYDVARIRQDITEGASRQGLGSSFQTDFEILQEEPTPLEQPSGIIDTRMETQPTGQRIDATVPQGYKEVLKRVAERYAQSKNATIDLSPELMTDIQDEYGAFRQGLTGRRAGQPDSQASTASQDEAASSESRPPVASETPRRDPLMPEAPPGRDPVTGLPIEPKATTPTSIEFAAALRHDQRLTTLTGPSKDRFNELMTAAEQKLKQGDYFTAEQRFDRALRFAPGHPLALAGVANAQIGAGLYLSASLTLRVLFNAQPEMIDVKFESGLMPAPERVTAAVAGITRRMEAAQDSDRASYALLLAYLGHQTDDVALIEQGLTAMEEAEPTHVLLQVLRQIWLPAPTEQSGQSAPEQ